VEHGGSVVAHPLEPPTFKIRHCLKVYFLGVRREDKEEKESEALKGLKEEERAQYTHEHNSRSNNGYKKQEAT
jgi:hypothetical protein